MRIAKKIKSKIVIIMQDFRNDVKFSLHFAINRLINAILEMAHINANYKYENSFVYHYILSQVKPVVEKYSVIKSKTKANDSNVIWVCWLQGVESAPTLVKKCINSIKNNSGDYIVNIITEENYHDYVSLDQCIVDKFHAGQMKAAVFCDYLRVSLLAQWGGIWLDATIYVAHPLIADFYRRSFFSICSNKTSNANSKYISNSRWTTYAIGGCKNNIIFCFLKDAFEQYWAHNEYSVSYLLFDNLICIGYDNISCIKQQIDSLPTNNPHRGTLMNAIRDNKDISVFSRYIFDDTDLYKLTYKWNPFKFGKSTIYDYFWRELNG